MANPLGANVTSSQNHYSDPVPVIGLYIAGATMVCFVLILCDIISGIRRRKQWFPCRFFSLNSVTLTLLSVSSKIPVDLTTPMPSAQDQVSKFTGTAILCIFMCFFFPSVGANSASDNTNNMVALSILVITVVVNICIQMSTGVIFSFIPEHAIIMFFMLVLLFYLWLCSRHRNNEKDILSDRNKKIFTKGRGSLLQRLEACYLHGCNSNPQIVSCTSFNFQYIICFISGSVLIITIEVTLRSFIAQKSRFDSGFSDYGWSMWIILATQILVILLGTSATAIRLLVTSSDIKWQVEAETRCINDETEFWLTETIPLLRTDVAHNLIIFLKISLIFLLLLTEVILFLPKAAFYCTFSLACCLVSESERTAEYEDLLHENKIKMSSGIKEKCVEEMKRWKSINGSESPSHLTQLLSRTRPSQPSLEQLNNQFQFKETPFKVSCLYLVFLARIASVLRSSTLNRGNLVESLREVFDIIYFVDTIVNSSELDELYYWPREGARERGEGLVVTTHPPRDERIRFEMRDGTHLEADRPLEFSKLDSRKARMCAKLLWRKFFISSASPQVVTGSSQDQSNVDQALEIIERSKLAISPSFVCDEVDIFVNFIRSRHYTSAEELYAYLEQVFVDMLHIFLIQLPVAIFREVTESSVEEYEERVRRMLKFAERVRPLEDKVLWSFPNVAGEITSMTTDQTFTASLVRDNRPDSCVHEGENCGCCPTLWRRLFKAMFSYRFSICFANISYKQYVERNPSICCVFDSFPIGV